MNKLTLLGLFLAGPLLVLAQQQPQIPTLQVCNLTGAMAVASSGSPQVHIASRTPGGYTGNVNVTVSASCDPTTGFPIGNVILSGISMSDSKVLGTISSVRIDQITSTGTDNPTAYMSGQCMAQEPGLATPAPVTVPCHFWILFAHTGVQAVGAPISTGPDIVSFLVFNKGGERIAYGTGPVIAGSGTIQVSPTKN